MTKFIVILAQLFLLCACSGSNQQALETAETAESMNSEDQVPEVETLQLIAEVLEIGIPEGLSKERINKSAEVDSFFYTLEMGINPLDLEFTLLKNSDENLQIEQQEKKVLFISDEGKTYEHPSGAKYTSKWYMLTYALEKKFRFTTYKDEEDYPVLPEELEKSRTGDSSMQEGQEDGMFPRPEFYTTQYIIKLSTSQMKKENEFVLVINVPVGC